VDSDPYRTSAKWYDTLLEPLNAGLRAIGIRMYPPREGISVLDIGCGTGTHLELYQQGGCRVYGIDTSSAMLNRARQKLGNRADLQLGNAAQMPYSDGLFELVILTLTLHEMPAGTRTAVINETKRVLKKEGRILLVDYHPGPVRFLKGWLSKVLIIFMEYVAGREHYTNYRGFLVNGGIPAVAAQHELIVEQERIVTGGNLGVYLLRCA
jgi:ubiquinone/menaquinone biosynthesis C-methylase UbiE